MALLVGVLLALTVGLMATVVGLDRDRAFYPTVTMVIVSLYALFAVMGASTQTLLLESLVDIEALPWQADWYAKKVEQALGKPLDPAS